MGSLIAGAPALAQLPLLQPAEQRGPFVREAFAAPYGRARVAERGKSLRASVDSLCLQTENPSAEQLTGRNRAPIVIRGTRIMEQRALFAAAKAHEIARRAASLRAERLPRPRTLA